MAYQQGYETNAQSMNGVVTITDGQGTIIQNGTIITNSLEVNNLSASEPTQTCSLFANQTATGIDIGNPSGATYVRSYWTPVSGYDVINYAYLTTTYYANLLGLTNIWTGISNTFNNVIYVSLISPIGTILSLGSSTNAQTSIQNSSALIVGTNPATYDGSGYIAGFGMRFYNSSPYSIFDMFSNTGVSGTNPPSARITVNGGTTSLNQGNLRILSGTIDLTSGTGDINLLSSAGVVKIEGLQISNLSITPITPSATVEICRTAGNALFMGNSTGSMSITGLGTAVDSAGSLYLGTNTSTTALTIGNLSLPNTLIKNSNALVIGKNPETYVTATGLMTAPGLALKNVAGTCQLGFHSNTLGNTENDARILVQSGAASGAATGDMTIQAGTISLLGTTNVKVESFTFISSSLQSTNVATTVDFFNNGNTVNLNIGNTGTLVSLGGTKTNLTVNANYSIEASAGGSNAFIDFHSYATAVNDYDARIICNGASAGIETGMLQFMSANNRFTGGISFSKGNLSAAQNIQTGSTSGQPQVAAGNPSGTATVVTFTTAFTGNPVVTACANSSSGVNASGLIISIASVSTTNFSYWAYNARSVNSGLWGIKWMAIGPY